MLPRQAHLLVALLIMTPFVTWGQQVLPTSVPTVEGNLVNKTFLIGHADEESPAASGYHSYFIFRPGGHATYRGTRGTTERSDSPLGWRVVGDSLFLTPGAATLEAGGQVQRIERATLRYAVIKVPGGYLLQHKAEQMRLTEVQ